MKNHVIYGLLEIPMPETNRYLSCYIQDYTAEVVNMVLKTMNGPLKFLLKWKVFENATTAKVK